MSRPISALVVSAVAVLLLGSAVPAGPRAATAAQETNELMTARPGPSPDRFRTVAAALVEPAPPVLPTPREALADGVLMVVSIPSQRIFVFREGHLWGSAPVSTGRPGHATPTGVFPILQKRVHHRSNLYSNAPMPFMQRLTWGGVALHAGDLPGYPASHGCIRLPWAFAEKLYAITDFTSSVALVTDRPIASAEEARQLGGGEPISRRAQRAARQTSMPPVSGSDGATQTIQLAATASPDNAAALWQELSRQRPQLAGLEHHIIPATVHARQVYRLRASGPGAHAICAALKAAGTDCLKV